MAYSLTGQKKCYVTENPEIVFFFFIAKLGYMNIQEEFLSVFFFFRSLSLQPQRVEKTLTQWELKIQEAKRGVGEDLASNYFQIMYILENCTAHKIICLIQNQLSFSAKPTKSKSACNEMQITTPPPRRGPVSKRKFQPWRIFLCFCSSPGEGETERKKKKAYNLRLDPRTKPWPFEECSRVAFYVSS